MGGKQNIKSSDLLDILDVKEERIKKLLQQLVSEGLIISEGGNRNRTYRLSE
jgi:DNA-binding PadR family transcriptional regulator